MKTYGEVRLLKGGRWEVKCQPHVMIRLKRTLEGISKGEFGAVHLSDTAENVRELAWFLERFPMAIADGLRRWQEQLDLAHERDRVVEQVRAKTWRPRPFGLALPLRRYQAVAAELALRTGRLLVADDVGLGKTATAIAVLSDPRARPALVVTLSHLPPQWRAELDRFLPGLDVVVPKLGRPLPADLERIQRGDLPDVWVLGYRRLEGWADVLAPLVRGLVLDEVQEMRTGSSAAKWTAACHVGSSAVVRVGLSATPVYNYGGEIHNVFEPLAPGELGSRAEFCREFCRGDSSPKAALEDPEAVGAMLEERGLMIRRTGPDVADEVPELSQPLKIPHLVDADERAVDRVKLASADLARIILSQGSGEAKMRAAGELDWRLRQATGIAKAPFVAAFVRMLVEAGERVVLWGWHLEVFRLWMDLLKEAKPVRYTGEESVAEKERSKAAFVAGDARVMLMSLRAGAGTDGLQDVCRVGVFGELDWSPGVHEQCGGRLWRPGQRDTVRLYFLHADSGADPIMVQVLGLKTAQVDGVKGRARGVLEAPVDAGEHMRLLALDVLARAERAGGGAPPLLAELPALAEKGLAEPSA